MRSLSLRLLLCLACVFLTPALFAHDVTITGTQTFASLDGSSSDHDGSANGVFNLPAGQTCTVTILASPDNPGPDITWQFTTAP